MAMNVLNGSTITVMKCGKPMVAVSNGAWQGDNPIQFALPLLILQICLVLIVTRGLALILRPLRQPRVIAEIMGGILLGPSALGRIETYVNHIFPKQSITVLDTVANLGLIFFLFLVGLELDLNTLKKTGRKALSIAGAGISVPFVGGAGVSLVLLRTIATESSGRIVPFLVFMGVAMSITAFPVLARILADRKLLTTEVGQMAMSAAAINDVAAWVLLALAVALSGSGKSPLLALWVLLSGLVFVLFMFIVVRPLLAAFSRNTLGNEPANESFVAITLVGVLISSFVTDSIGIHVIFGAFVFGLIVPKEGPFAGMMIEKIEDLVTTLMLPLYFASSGLKTNIGSIHGVRSIGLLILVIATACIGKVLGTFVTASLHKMSVRKALTLGFLMNTKGLVELIVLNIGKDHKVINDETFAIMVLMALVTTFITTPTVMWLYKPARTQVPYSRRVIYRPRFSKDPEEDEDLRVLACVNGMPNVRAVMNLVEASRGTRKKTLRMYVLHLLELTERPSSIMKVQKVRRNGLPSSSDSRDDVDNVVLTFDTYQQLSKVTVQVMTAISSFDDMHEDICVVARQKRACLVVIPFHKHTNSHREGGINPRLRNVNLRVLSHAPCSVGILVDRGIGTRPSHSCNVSSGDVDHNVAVLFFGGPDDREAVSLGYRMAEHPGVRLTIFRFIHGPIKDHVAISMPENDGQHAHEAHGDIINVSPSFSQPLPFSTRYTHEGYCDFMVTSDMDIESEYKLDEECLAILKQGTQASVVYEERVVNGNPIEVATEVGKIEGFTLLLVGRGRRPSLMIASLARQEIEFPELGPIGNALMTTSTTPSSILVIQQHDALLVKEEVHPRKAIEDASFSKMNKLFPSDLLVATGPSTTTNSNSSSDLLSSPLDDKVTSISSSSSSSSSN